MINILQIGFGPLGIQIGNFIAQKSTIETIAVIDLSTNLIGKSLKEIDSNLSNETYIYDSIASFLKASEIKPDIAIITTVSSLEKLIPQVHEVAKLGIPVISTCEELSYPWVLQPKLSQKLDEICKQYNIACLGTGVNPGFLMDYLPSVMSSVCENIEKITVERVQDATPRRIPFQQKIGAGLSIEEFRNKESEGTLRHVGLKESVYLLAKSIGLELDEVIESLEPVLALEPVSSSAINVDKGEARGVEQIAFGNKDGICKIEMHFKAAIGEPRSFDRITVKGTPSFSSEIDGGINGDIATCAIAINAINSVLNASPGLHTMNTISLPGYIN